MWLGIEHGHMCKGNSYQKRATGPVTVVVFLISLVVLGGSSGLDGVNGERERRTLVDFGEDYYAGEFGFWVAVYYWGEEEYSWLDINFVSFEVV